MRSQVRSRVRSRLRSLVGPLAAACLVASACSSDGDPPPKEDPGALPAPCRTDLLAGWRSEGLAVLWVPSEGEGLGAPLALPAAVAAMDVHSGQVRSYCPLPSPAGELRQAQVEIPMRQGGVDYPATTPGADLDLMLRTQWISPDFRWFGAPGLPLVEVGQGPVEVVLPGTLAGVGRDVVLVRTEAGAEPGWCTLPLPPRPDAPCAPLPPGAGAGSFVIGVDGEPVWLPAETVSLPFGRVTAYAVTDGTRIYAADTAPAADRRDEAADHDGVVRTSVDIDPGGAGGFQTFIDHQPVHDLVGWFSVRPSGGAVGAQYHSTTGGDRAVARMRGKAEDVSRALAEQGRVAVSASLDPGPEFGDPAETHFRAVVDGTDRVIDLTRERGLRCPVRRALCRIVAWPDGSLDARGAGSG